MHRVESMSDLNFIIDICSNTEGVLLGGKDLDEDQKCIVSMVGKLWVKTNEIINCVSCYQYFVMHGYDILYKSQFGELTRINDKSLLNMAG